MDSDLNGARLCCFLYIERETVEVLQILSYFQKIKIAKS
jgi:hypothetical protein